MGEMYRIQRDVNVSIGRYDMPTKTNPKSQGSTTRVVSPEIFKQVYDSPLSLPGKHRWVTKDEDVRTIEKLLGIPEKSIGSPLWVSGDTHHCAECGRETNWLDIVSSALTKTHQKALLVDVILGERKYVNVEAVSYTHLTLPTICSV